MILDGMFQRLKEIETICREEGQRVKDVRGLRYRPGYRHPQSIYRDLLPELGILKEQYIQKEGGETIGRLEREGFSLSEVDGGRRLALVSSYFRIEF